MNSNVEFGFKRTAVSLGLDPYELMAKKAAQDIVDNSLEDQRLYSKVGQLIMEKAGYAGTPAHRVLEKCASADYHLSNETYEAYIRPVKDVLCKSAAMKVLKGTAALLSQSPSTFAALMLGSGALGGASLYALKRSVDQVDAEAAAKFEQARIYREQANKIAEQMAKKTNTPTNNSGFIF